jgi:hypothetical protein
MRNRIPGLHVLSARRLTPSSTTRRIAAMAHKVAILDDYQHIALSSAGWSSILPQVSVDTYDTTLQPSEEDALASRLIHTR